MVHGIILKKKKPLPCCEVKKSLNEVQDGNGEPCAWKMETRRLQHIQSLTNVSLKESFFLKMKKKNKVNTHSLTSPLYSGREECFNLFIYLFLLNTYILTLSHIHQLQYSLYIFNISLHNLVTQFNPHLDKCPRLMVGKIFTIVVSIILFAYFFCNSMDLTYVNQVRFS